jgi:hypothetical protein
MSTAGRERLRHAGDVMRDGPSEATPLPDELPFSVEPAGRERLREALTDALESQNLYHGRHGTTPAGSATAAAILSCLSNHHGIDLAVLASAVESLRADIEALKADSDFSYWARNHASGSKALSLLDRAAALAHDRPFGSGLRELLHEKADLLERFESPMSTWTNLVLLADVHAIINEALAALSGSSDPEAVGLDARVLRHAIAEHGDNCSRMALPECSEAIAAEYARLSPSASDDGETP